MSAEEIEIEENFYCPKCGSGEFDEIEVKIEGKVIATRIVCANCGEVIEADAVR